MRKSVFPTDERINAFYHVVRTWKVYMQISWFGTMPEETASLIHSNLKRQGAVRWGAGSCL